MKNDNYKVCGSKIFESLKCLGHSTFVTHQHQRFAILKIVTACTGINFPYQFCTLNLPKGLNRQLKGKLQLIRQLTCLKIDFNNKRISVA